jgi:phenylpropionate dioxygenase-like ring-hydroxylating dioxygenase large terminal subunit
MKRTPGFDPREHHLAEIRCEIWQGWIYVTLDPAAESVARLLAPLEAMVAPYDMAGYLPIADQDHVWNTNWKLLTENFMEGYHLRSPIARRWGPGSRPRTRSSVGECPGLHLSDLHQVRRRHLWPRPSANTRLEGPQRFTSVMPTIFPSHMYVLAPDHLWYLSLRPKSVGEVHVRFGAALAPEVMASLNDPEGFTADLVGFFDRVNAEDRVVVEGLYEGTGAPLAKPGRLSWLEREIHDFMGYLARGLCSENPS